MKKVILVTKMQKYEIRIMFHARRLNSWPAMECVSYCIQQALFILTAIVLVCIFFIIKINFFEITAYPKILQPLDSLKLVFKLNARSMRGTILNKTNPRCKKSRTQQQDTQVPCETSRASHVMNVIYGQRVFIHSQNGFLYIPVKHLLNTETSPVLEMF